MAEEEKVSEQANGALRQLLDAGWFGGCLFCRYHGAGYYQEGTHAESCPWFHVGGREERAALLPAVLAQSFMQVQADRALIASLERERDEQREECDRIRKIADLRAAAAYSAEQRAEGLAVKGQALAEENAALRGLIGRLLDRGAWPMDGACEKCFPYVQRRGWFCAQHEARAALSAWDASRPASCAICGKPATCIGRYEAMEDEAPEQPACDECCGHGNEDGHCRPIEGDASQPEPERSDCECGILAVNRKNHWREPHAMFCKADASKGKGCNCGQNLSMPDDEGLPLPHLPDCPKAKGKAGEP